MLKGISLYQIRKGVVYLKHYGWKKFWVRVKERGMAATVDYATWYQNHKATEKELDTQRKKTFPYSPKISIVVPAYHTPETYLEQMIVSVVKQTYANWELCIANASPCDEKMAGIIAKYVQKDSRIQMIDVPENEGIAQNTNAAVSIASGEYIGFLDHDDVLAENALFEMVTWLNKDKSTDLLYSDEDKVTEDLSTHFCPHFKPEFNLDLLRSNNYICHFCVIRKSILDEMGGILGEFNGAQDHDLMLRISEKTRKIVRIPKVLYHWRTHQDSTSDNPLSKKYAYDAGKAAIQGHLDRCGERAEVIDTDDPGFYRTIYQVEGEPLISIIIPNKDHVEDLDKCLKSIETSNYKNVEIIIVENNSENEETFSYYEKIQSETVKVLFWENDFNYSAINNFAVRHAKGEYLLFLNNDVEVITPNWLEEMLANCQRKDVGIVGAKLYYPDDKVQHAGVIIGLGGIAGHAFWNLQRDCTGYMHKASIQQNLSAVTAACMMVKRSVFDEIKGFDENLAVAFNDVDFCLRVREKGHLIVYNPQVELYHYESKTRGSEDTKEKIERFQGEIAYMEKRWADILEEGDPMYNPNLTLKKWDYSL